MIRTGLLLCAAAAPVVAQTEPSQAKPPVLIDTVVATVNDSAILHSELATLTAGRLRTLEASGRTVRPEDRDAIYADELRSRIDHHTWAQAAKTFGYVAPEQVEAWFQRELEREEQNQVRDLGSYQAYTRALQDQGRTWPTLVRQMRVDKLAGIAKDFSIEARMQRQANLYVTPRMLRETYERFRPQFVHDAEARVALLSFRGPQAAENAAKASAIWRAEDLTARALAQRFPGATVLEGVTASALIPPLSTFALAGPVDRVSDPIPHEGTLQVAKIVLFAPARSGSFEDPAVQLELRDICDRLVRTEFALQALRRARQRTEVWVGKPPR